MAKRPGAALTAAVDVRGAWARLEAWFAAHRPDLDLTLRPPATAKAIAAAEKKLGVALPADFRESLLVHDGQENHPGVRIIPYAMRLGSLASLTACWKDDRALFDEHEMRERLEWLDDGRRVRQVHQHPKHVPIAGSPFWDYDRLLLDFAPGPRGTAGQVIARDDVEVVFVCRSFGELLDKTARGLEVGAITVEKSTDESRLVYRAAKSKKPVRPDVFFSR
ncbi:MAG: SMI1/KNR4 family protein [Myxococcaceae bacterium]|nr:SMI1/KNR4 family protein [Myxococcaceae bacterium]